MNRMFDVDEIMKKAKFSLVMEDMFALKDMKARRLFLEGEIDDCSTSEVKDLIERYNIDDKDLPIKDRRPIWLYLCSNGGSVVDGFGLIDVIEASKTPVHIVNTGYCWSMAALIFLAGHKRYAMKHAQFLIHDGNIFHINSTNKAQDYAKFEEEYEETVVKKFILEHSDLTEELYKSKERVEWFFLPEEAKQYGMVDVIVNDLDEILGGELE